MVSITTPHPVSVPSPGRPCPPTTGAISRISSVASASLRRVSTSSTVRFATRRRVAPTNISPRMPVSFSLARSVKEKLSIR